MVRELLVCVAITAAAWGIALGAAPVAQTEPADANCTEVSSTGNCVYKNCTDAHAQMQHPQRRSGLLPEAGP